MPAILAVTGLGLLALGLSAHEGWIAAANPEMADRLSTSAGALTLAAAHLVNWRWRHRSGGHKRSEEHTSELQSLMRISYAVFCLKKKKKIQKKTTKHQD